MKKAIVLAALLLVAGCVNVGTADTEQHLSECKYEADKLAAVSKRQVNRAELAADCMRSRGFRLDLLRLTKGAQGDREEIARRQMDAAYWEKR